MTTLALACNSTNADDRLGVVISPISNAATSIPVATPTAVPHATLTGFSWPLAGGCLPKGDQLLPNAARPYRNGIHEGVDFYAVDNCTSIVRNTPVLAAKPGVVI